MNDHEAKRQLRLQGYSEREVEELFQWLDNLSNKELRFLRILFRNFEFYFQTEMDNQHVN